MPADTGIGELTDAVLHRMYDAGSVERGIAYAEQGRATVLSTSAGTLRGVVSGSGRQTYLTEISWSRGPRGVVIDDECTCPVGDGCKHCVALIVTARGHATKNARPGESDWRRALANIVGQAGGGSAGTGSSAKAVPMALSVAMAPGTPGRYGAPPTPPQPTIRPLRQGKNGKWVRTGASWRDISSPYQYSNRDLDPSHLSVLKAMVAGADGVGYYADAKPIALSRFGPNLWFHLARAVDEGVVLVDADGRSGAVALSSDPAEVTVDMTADADGAVTVSPRLIVGERELTLEPGRSGILGAPGRGLFVQEDEVLDLIPLAAPLHPDIASLLTAPPLVVPPADVDELLDSYQPALARLAVVSSSDGSVEMTTTEFEGLVLEVERTSVDSAVLRWKARYRRGARAITHPLHPFSHQGRSHTNELRALGDLRLPTHLLHEVAAPDGEPRDIVVTGRHVVTALTEVVPWLQAEGQVAVEVLGDHPDLREAVEDPLISLVVADGEGKGGRSEHDGTDWFDLSITVSVDGEPVELAQLLTALTQGEELLILPSGSWLRLDRPELARLRELIEEARGLVDVEGSGVVRVNRFQTSWWDDMASLGIVEQQSARWVANVERMRDLTAPKSVDPPAGLSASLRPYQQEGLDWLTFLYRNRLGGILADDMGLGKTVQTLALCLQVLEHEPDARFLVVAPTSVVQNWHREAATFAPGVEVATIHETRARRATPLSEAIGDARIVVTSYALFRIEFDHYQSIDWELLLLDEAQFVKNHRGKTYQCVRRLDATVKIALTGTPLENSLMDLWSLLSITAPGLYPDPKRFAEVYQKPIESGRAPELLSTLRRRIAPLMRRRTKDAVLDDLPPKTEQTVEVELSPRHARIYQTQLQRQRQKVLGLVGDVQQNRFEILKSLTLLRQLSLDPGLTDPKHDAVGSAKLDRLVDDLTQVVAEGHRALVFSQFTRYLARVRKRLDDAGIDHAYLDGRTRKRDAAISAFKDGGLPVFVISLKAGGFGLNLTEADYCFVLDPWWNPAVETQAIDRTHRIGQHKSVMVYRYVSAGTIEEKVMELKARKAKLFASVMEADGALSGALTADDIRGLLDLSD